MNTFHDTMPVQRKQPLGLDYQGRFPEAAHAASEIDDDAEDARRGVEAMGALLIYAVLVVATALLAVFWPELRTIF